MFPGTSPSFSPSFPPSNPSTSMEYDDLNPIDINGSSASLDLTGNPAQPPASEVAASPMPPLELGEPFMQGGGAGGT